MGQSAQWRRVEAAIAGEAVDRAPFGFWMHVPEIDRDARKLAPFTVDLYRRYQMDYVKVMFRSSWGVEDWGETVAGFHPGRGYWLADHLPIREPEDWATLKRLPPDQGTLGEQLQLLRMVRDGVAGEAPVLATLFAPTMLAAHLAGEATFLRHLREAPDAVDAGLQTIAATLGDFADACLDQGADGLFYAIQHASHRVMPVAEYQPLADRYDRAVLAEVHARSRLTKLHLHGDALMFELLADFPAHVLNWYDRGGGPSLAEARALTDRCLAGGIDHERTLLLGTPAEIAGEVTAAIRDLDGRGLMIAPGCGVPITVPERSLRMLRDAAVGDERGS